MVADGVVKVEQYFDEKVNDIVTSVPSSDSRSSSCC